MKKLLVALIVLAVLLSGCDLNGLIDALPNVSTPTNPAQTTPPVDPDDCAKHTDGDDNGICDSCYTNLIVNIDFYSINDLHGKLADGDNHPGVDELTTYLKNARKTDDYAIFLSAGDMWQGAAESNMTRGNIITDWMNELDFAAMTLGNHEYDWGSEYIRQNSEIAQFPFLAINVYDRATNKRADYCEASVVVEASGLQIGIIGAIGDCYSSIAVDKCRDVYFKTDSALTALVKEESNRLRAQGVDFVVYVLHDGYASDAPIESYYDTALSNGYVDLVFEGHTHQGYRLVDNYGVYHLQSRGDNLDGISHVEIGINSVTNTFVVQEVGQISKTKYQSLSDDPIVTELLKKYEKEISKIYEVLGSNRTKRYSSYLCQLVADLYYEAGVEKWGMDYNIVLGGGFMSPRSPYDLHAGQVTYGDLMDIFPFDNELVLCSVSGRDLRTKFVETTNSRYYIGNGANSDSLYKNLNDNATYYIIVDTYTAYYSYNNLTVVKMYGEQLFARDLLADYIREGGLVK